MKFNVYSLKPLQFQIHSDNSGGLPCSCLKNDIEIVTSAFNGNSAKRDILDVEI